MIKGLLSRLNCRSAKAIDYDNHCHCSCRCQVSSRIFLDRLQSNDPTVTGWVLTNEFAHLPFGEIMEALRANHTLEKVHISRTFVQRLSVIQQHLFWQVMATSPNLVCLSLADFRDNFPLPTTVLTTFLQHSQKGMVELDLSHVRLKGNLEQLQSVLQSHESLKSIQIWDVDVYHPETRNNNDNNGEENDNDNNNNATGPSQVDLIKMLLSIPHLKNLSLGSLPFDATQLTCIAEALSIPGNQLKSLRLRGGTTPERNDNQQNPTQQQGTTAVDVLEMESTVALAKMLQVNTSLTSLELSNLQLAAANNNSKSGLVLLAHALQHSNRTLQSFHLFQVNLFCRQDMTQEENEALVAMLEDNHVLTSFLPNGTCNHDQIELLLKWNRWKLRGIHVDVNQSRDKVVKLFAGSLREELDCIYHVLRTNPAMMN